MRNLKRAESLLLFLTILFLPTQLGKHFWPESSYIYSLKIDYLSPTIYFWDILVFLLVSVFLINKGRFVTLPLNIFLIFIFTQIFSLVSTLNITAGFVRLEQYLVAGAFGLYIASSVDIKSKMALPLIVSLIGESLLAILQVVKTGSLGFWILGERAFTITTPAIAKFDFYGIEMLRPYATFPHPNVLAAFLLVVTLLLIGNKEFFKKTLFVSGFLAMLVLILTFSRTAILAGVISLAFILKKKAIYMGIVLLVFASPLLFTRFSSLLSYDNLTFSRRAELAEKAISYFVKSPLIGVGLNNFIPTLSDDVLSGPNRFLQPVHNIFLLALAETGIIGFIGLLVLLFFPILHLKPKTYNLKPIFLVWCTILFLGMFDHYFLTLPQGYRLLFLVWGFSFVEK